MKRNKMTILICTIFILVAAAVCVISGSKKKSTETTAPDIDPNSLYEQAIEQIRSADKHSYYVITEQITALENQKFTKVSQQRINIQSPEKETGDVSIRTALDFGKLSVDFSEQYSNGSAYITVGENTFASPYKKEDYDRRYAPEICFEPTLYTDIQTDSFGSYTCIFFQNATDAESWALPADGVFTGGSGYAVLNSDGKLKESFYSVSYQLDDTNVTKSTKIIHAGRFHSAVPIDTSNAIAIDCLDAPLLLEQACGYLLQAEDVTSSGQTVIDCQTFSIHRTQAYDLTLSDGSNDFYAQLDVQINQVNQSRGGETTHIKQSEIYKNGKYSIRINDVEQTNSQNIDVSAMRSYCHEMLVGNILLPNHISGATAEENDGTIILTFQPSDALAEAICSNICDTLYSDAGLLHALSSEYTTQSIQCSLVLDKYTGLPLSFTSQYSACHIIEDISYQLERTTEQSYRYS